MLFGAALAVLGVLPAGPSPPVAGLQSLVVALATPLLLLSADLTVILKRTGSMLGAFVCGAMGTTLGALLGFWLVCVRGVVSYFLVHALHVWPATDDIPHTHTHTYAHVHTDTYTYTHIFTLCHPYSLTHTRTHTKSLSLPALFISSLAHYRASALSRARPRSLSPSLALFLALFLALCLFLALFFSRSLSLNTHTHTCTH